MKYKILMVDDDENILAGYTRHLRKEFEVHTAGSGFKGLELLKEKGPFHVAVSDLNMPEMDGFDFLSRLNTQSPSTICIMITGYAELQTSLKAFNEDYIFRFLTKPCKINILEKTIKEAVEKYLQEDNKRNFQDQKKEIRRFLIVDNDQEELSRISSALNPSEATEVLTAESSFVAEKILDEMTITLVMVSASIALENDCRFLSQLRQKFPGINLAVTTWCKSQSLEKKLSVFNIGKYFEKPIALETLSEVIKEEYYSGPKGIIDGISIATFLQMLEMEEKTCTLKISQGEKNGKIFFKKGSLFDASYGELGGEEAAYEIINWEKAGIEIENHCNKNERKIQNSLMGILMEAAKIKDHEEEDI